MKKKILLTGSSIKGNLGAGAMTSVLIDHLTRKNNHLKKDIGILSHRYDLDKIFIKKNNIKIFNYGGIIRNTFVNILLHKLLKINIFNKNDTYLAFEWCDIVIDIHGINFTESDDWVSSILIPGFMIWCGTLLGKKTIKFTQTFGPIDSFFKRVLSKFFLSKALLLVPREKESYEFLKSLNLKNITKPFVDSAFNLKAVKVAKIPSLLNKRYFNIGFIPSAVMNQKSKSYYIEFCVDFIRSINTKNNNKIIIFCHKSFEKNAKIKGDDFTIADKIYSHFRNNPSILLYKKDMNPNEIKYFISKFDCLISSRYHAIIAGLSQNIPSFVLSWSYKYDSILRKYRMNKYVLSSNDLRNKNNSEKLKKFIEDNKSIKSKMSKITPFLSKKSLSSFTLLNKFI